MPRDGAGTYTLPAGNPVVTGTTISSTVQNNTTSDIATALTSSLTKDGQTTPTANLPLGGFKITGVGAATARTDAASIATIQDGTGVYVGTVGGTADAITLTPSPAITVYVAGQSFYFVSSGANTTAATVAISGLAAKSITKRGATALAAGDIPSGALVRITYDGTQFQLVLLGEITLTGTQTLTNKTLTSPVINSATGIGQSIVKRKTADESVTSSTTLQDDDDLQFPIAANEEWTASFYVRAGDAFGTTGAGVAVSVPAGATMAAWAIVKSSSANTVIGGESTTSDGLIVNSSLATTFGLIEVRAWVLNSSTAGSVKLRWTQTFSSGTALTFKKGSYMHAIRST